jgi:UDP-N-acetylglucosamine--N-acetylmuramyl-(pentapeptide) pyrophosphoryl-undecaprenol N-acetylglucosamine transferase
MRLLVAGGGTGGHLFPGLALGEEVKTRHPRNDVLFVGSARGIEAREVPKAGYPLQIIDVGPLKRMGLAGMVRGLFRIPLALWQSMQILRKFDPDVVIGVGGYSSGPVLLPPPADAQATAIRSRTRSWVHQSHPRAIRGRDLHRLPAGGRDIPGAQDAFWATPSGAFLDNYLHTKPPSDRLGLFVPAGRRGPRAQQKIAEALEILAPECGSRLQVLHQTGVKDQPEIAARYAKLEATGLKAQAVAFIDDMPRAYGGADLLICRAGATTIAELTVCKKPAILVPFPFAADDHQTVNARSLVEAEAAVLLPERPDAQAWAEIRALEEPAPADVAGQRGAGAARGRGGDRRRLRFGSA